MLHTMERRMKCPYTGKKLELDESGKYFKVEDSNTVYTVYDGIINFIPDIGEQAFKSYNNSAGHMLKNLNDLMQGEKAALQDKISLPSQFSAVALDIPSGSHYFTIEQYRKYREATFIVADSNPAFLLEAKKRYKQEGIDNVFFLCCQTDKLPLTDGVVGMAVSVLNFDRVKKKEETINEISRALRVSGTFAGAFFVKDERIENFFKDNDIYSETFSSQEEIKTLLSNKFDMVDQELVETRFLFDCRKSWPSCGVRW